MSKKQDELCKFVLDNYEDLGAAAKVFDMGKEHLHEWVKMTVYEALKEDNEHSGFETILEENEILWWLSDSDKLWLDQENSKGLFFSLQIEADYSNSIVQPTEDEIYLCLYHSADSPTQKGKVNKLRAHILSYKGVIKKEGFSMKDEDGCLVGYTPSHELNLTAIRDENRFPADIVKKARKFTDTLLPIVQKYKTK